MRRSMHALWAWCYDLLWFLADLRHSQPRRFAALSAAMLGSLVLVPLLALTLSDGGSAASHQHQAMTVRTDVAGAQRVVPYNGLPTSIAQDATSLESGPMILPEQQRVVRVLSDVLHEEIDFAGLIYGSDGSEGGILPLDNGVVPSSGPRFDTSWELILPSARIRAAVVQVGLTSDGDMGSPDNPFVAGWFNRSAVPGEPGNALLGGHRDYQDRDGNVDVGVCWELDETRVGDQLLMFDGARNHYFVYEIVDKVTIRPDSSAAEKYLSQTRESVVTLITCAGEFDEDSHSYDQRIIVVALLTAVARPDA
ncbi:MAG: class F sortase [Chloroflexi bacterium]|nr:class F sortase [Chloroflexota bacterium]MCY3695582.1 class F sortase [Chloroflexota bacterium]